MKKLEKEKKIVQEGFRRVFDAIRRDMARRIFKDVDETFVGTGVYLPKYEEVKKKWLE